MAFFKPGWHIGIMSQFFTMLYKEAKGDITPPALPDVRLQADRVVLRPPRADDWARWRTIRADNRDYLTPYEPAWPDNALEQSFWMRRQLKLYRQWHNDKRYAFVICARDSGAIIGGVNVNNVKRKTVKRPAAGDVADAEADAGAANAPPQTRTVGTATFGYWIAEDRQGQGYMTEALAALLKYCFDFLALDRIEIACLSDNEKSMNVARRLSFTYQGVKKNYMQINGRLQDHHIFHLTRRDFIARQSSVPKQV